MLVIRENVVIEDIVRGNNQTGYVYQDVVRFSCIDGYKLNGDKYAGCNANGQWTSRPPLCQREFLYMYVCLSVYLART